MKFKKMVKTNSNSDVVPWQSDDKEQLNATNHEKYTSECPRRKELELDL